MRASILFLLLPISVAAAVMNFDIAIGTSPWFGVTLSPHIEFWRIEADLSFSLGVVIDQGRLNLSPLYEPFENLKYLSLDLGTGGALYRVPYAGWLSFSNLNYEANTLSLWGMNGSIGAVIQDSYALFFKIDYFSICVDNNSGYHLSVPISFNDFKIEPFISNLGYGVGLSHRGIVFFLIPNMGLRIGYAADRLFFFAQYLANKTNVGFGWVNEDEWVLVSNESMDFRKKIDKIYVIFRSEKERWYAGFSFPVFW